MKYTELFSNFKFSVTQRIRTEIQFWQSPSTFMIFYNNYFLKMLAIHNTL